MGTDKKPLSSPKTIRVVFVLPTLVRSGLVTQTLAIAQSLAREPGFSVTVALMKPQEGNPPDISPARFSQLAKTKRLPGVPARFYRARRRARVLRHVARVVAIADVVVSSYEFGPGLIDVEAASRAAKKPLVAIVQNNPLKSIAEYGDTWTIEKTLALWRGCAGLVFPSAALREIVVSQMADNPPPTRVIPNGVDIAHVSQKADDQAVTLPTTQPFFVAVGRLAHQKGMDVFIRAHALIDQKRSPHDIVIIGAGTDDERTSLRDLADSLHVTNTVHFVDYLSNSVAPLRHALACVVPSRYDGHSMVLTECAVLGVPVIATDCPTGPAEILDGGRYGDLVPADDPHTLAQAMTAHLHDPTALQAKASLSAQDNGRLSVYNSSALYAQFFREIVQ